MALTIWGLRGGCDRVSVCIGAGYDPRRHSTVGFAMVFNVPVRALRWCALLARLVMVPE